MSSFQLHQIPSDDRAIAYGDGCFTTAHLYQGEIRLLGAHLQRLQQHCEKLHIPFNQWQGLAQALTDCAAQHNNEQVIKVIISRGSGGRGYASTGADNPRAWFSVHEYPAHYQQWREQGITLSVNPVRLGQQPLLAGLKTLNRLEQVLVKHAQSGAAEDALVLDTEGFVVETSAANLFWRIGEHWYTPYLGLSGIQGVMRNHLLAWFAQQAIHVTEIRVRPEALLHADELLICNSLMGIVPVRSVQLADDQQQRFQNQRVQQLQQALNP